MPPKRRRDESASDDAAGDDSNDDDVSIPAPKKSKKELKAEARARAKEYALKLASSKASSASTPAPVKKPVTSVKSAVKAVATPARSKGATRKSTGGIASSKESVKTPSKEAFQFQTPSTTFPSTPQGDGEFGPTGTPVRSPDYHAEAAASTVSGTQTPYQFGKDRKSEGAEDEYPDEESVEGVPATSSSKAAPVAKTPSAKTPAKTPLSKKAQKEAAKAWAKKEQMRKSGVGVEAPAKSPAVNTLPGNSRSSTMTASSLKSPPVVSAPFVPTKPTSPPPVAAVSMPSAPVIQPAPFAAAAPSAVAAADTSRTTTSMNPSMPVAASANNSANSLAVSSSTASIPPTNAAKRPAPSKSVPPSVAALFSQQKRRNTAHRPALNASSKSGGVGLSGIVPVAAPNYSSPSALPPPTTFDPNKAFPPPGHRLPTAAYCGCGPTPFSKTSSVRSRPGGTPSHIAALNAQGMTGGMSDLCTTNRFLGTANQHDKLLLHSGSSSYGAYKSNYSTKMAKSMQDLPPVEPGHTRYGYGEKLPAKRDVDSVAGGHEAPLEPSDTSVKPAHSPPEDSSRVAATSTGMVSASMTPHRQEDPMGVRSDVVDSMHVGNPKSPDPPETTVSSAEHKIDAYGSSSVQQLSPPMAANNTNNDLHASIARAKSMVSSAEHSNRQRREAMGIRSHLDEGANHAPALPGESTQETGQNMNQQPPTFVSSSGREQTSYSPNQTKFGESNYVDGDSRRSNFKFSLRYFFVFLPFALALYYRATHTWEGHPISISFGGKEYTLWPEFLNIFSYSNADANLKLIDGPVENDKQKENDGKPLGEAKCFVDHPSDFYFSGEKMEDFDACEGKFQECPTWGRCHGGILRDCNDSGGDVSDLVRFIPNESKDTCVPSPDVVDIVKSIEVSLLAMTASQMCKSSDMLGKEDVVWWGEDSFPLFNLEKVAQIMTKKTPMQMTPALLLWLSPVFDPSRVKFGGSTGKEDDFEAIGLSSAVSPNELPFSLTCSMKLMMWDMVGFFGSLAASLASISFKLSWRFVVDHPLISICIGVLLKILHYVQVRRRRLQRIKELLSIVREAVYDRLSELEENVVYAALILRDDIGHDLYPSFESDRLFLYQEVWPRVVAEVRADNRIRKFRKMANGKDLEHWEFDPQSKRSRRMRKSLGSTTPNRAVGSKPEIKEERPFQRDP